MKTKQMPMSPRPGERLEDRYGHVGIRAVAGAIKPVGDGAKSAKRSDG